MSRCMATMEGGGRKIVKCKLVFWAEVRHHDFIVILHYP